MKLDLADMLMFKSSTAQRFNARLQLTTNFEEEKNDPNRRT